MNNTEMQQIKEKVGKQIESLAIYTAKIISISESHNERLDIIEKTLNFIKGEVK